MTSDLFSFLGIHLASDLFLARFRGGPDIHLLHPLGGHLIEAVDAVSKEQAEKASYIGYEAVEVVVVVLRA